jgi:hypothetical protein
MRRSPLWRILLAACILLLIPVASVHADIGRKPTMEFSFQYEIEPVGIVSGQLIECENEACQAGEPLESVGPQHFTCAENACSSMAYGYAPYHKLAIEFADRVRESNVFTKRATDAVYRVTVSEATLLVEEIRGGGGGLRCCSGLAATMALETLVAIVYLGLLRLPKTVLGWVPLSSMLSLPVVWFVFPRLTFPTGWIVGLSEVFAFLFEAGFLYLAARRAMSLKHVAALSLAMNSISFLVGLVLSL